MRKRVYLDWNATTPLRPEARSAMLAAFDVSGNPSSVHSEGRAARKLIEDARAAVAAAVGGDVRNVVFTSGGTEANALALAPGLRRGNGQAVRRLIVSAIEHPSVLAGGRFPQNAIEIAPVLPSGVVDLATLETVLADQPPALVSVMLANNETGAIQPIPEIAALVHEVGGLLHVDAVQALEKMPININELGADILTVSGHKVGGPKGTGALIVADGLYGLQAQVRGGGQEQGRRAGTENVTGIAGFGAAVKAAMASREANAARAKALQARLERGLRDHPGAVIFSGNVPRLPNTTLVSAPGMKAETAVIGFDLEGIAVSSGSACSSGKVQPSHVLRAMNADPALITGAIRLSMGWDTTEADIDRCLEAWRKLSGVLRNDTSIGLEQF
ncbi:cysteine desulfurase family protein [Bradyrhizobium sp. G127]|uniref:cysteine desulfurase family protein n=1 Tax=Bradyrhizobium sp. G127 TaxID=2904800 RepID=UPI001F26BD09|nr:cysteine desulfurase family protein [Bradyrhizobium sp. G127]MCF2523480.1 cysteine desulfurase [Bradyrhizobium sp. G127]